MLRAISWIDRAEAARLVAALDAPVGSAPPADKPAPSVERASSAIAVVPATIRNVAGSGLVPKPAPLPSEPPPAPLSAGELPPFVVPSGPLFTRVQALCQWIDLGLAPASVYLADEHGLLVYGVRTRVEYGAAMAPLLGAMSQIGRVLGEIPRRGSMRVRDGEVLSWVECRASLGNFCLGILTPDAVVDRALARVGTELARVLEGEGT